MEINSLAATPDGALDGPFLAAAGGWKGDGPGEELQKRVLRAKPFPRRSERYRTLCDRTLEPIDLGLRIPHGKRPIDHESTGTAAAWAGLSPAPLAHVVRLADVHVLRVRADLLLQHPDPLGPALL